MSWGHFWRCFVDVAFATRFVIFAGAISAFQKHWQNYHTYFNFCSQLCFEQRFLKTDKLSVRSFILIYQNRTCVLTCLYTHSKLFFDNIELSGYGAQITHPANRGGQQQSHFRFKIRQRRKTVRWNSFSFVNKKLLLIVIIRQYSVWCPAVIRHHRVLGTY